MQMRSKTYLQFISLWRSFRGLITPHDGDASTETSTTLIFIAVVLAVSLAILEVDLHRDKLEALGLLTKDYPVAASFVSP